MVRERKDESFIVKGSIMITLPSRTIGCSQDCGPFLVVDYITAPDISGYPNATLNFGNYP